MKYRNIVIVIVIVLLISAASWMWLFNHVSDTLGVTQSIDVELISQEKLDDNTVIRMIVRNNSEKAIVSYKVGLIVISTNCIEVQSPENNMALEMDSSHELEFVFPNEKITYDTLNTDDFEIHIEGYVEKVGKYNDFTQDSHYQYYIEKRDEN